jgi:hypothetical protein
MEPMDGVDFMPKKKPVPALPKISPEEAEALKNQGNEAFKVADYNKAI